MQKINLPTGGFVDADCPRIAKLDVAIGERGENHTELFVRGQVVNNRGVRLPFAGTTILREGRDVDHDIEVLGPAPSSLADEVALAVHLALDAHAEELVAAEIERICG